MSALLSATGMTIWRGDNLLVDAVDVDVHSGSIVQIQGTNGSGKTTLLRALIGLAEYDERYEVAEWLIDSANCISDPRKFGTEKEAPDQELDYPNESIEAE